MLFSARKKKDFTTRKEKSICYDKSKSKQPDPKTLLKQKSKTYNAKTKSPVSTKSYHKSENALTNLMKSSDNLNIDDEYCAMNDREVSEIVGESYDELSDGQEDDNGYVTMSKATLIDQNSGEIYQVYLTSHL